MGNVEMTSMERELSEAVDLERVKQAFIEAFAAVFSCKLDVAPPGDSPA
jgi:lipoate-protein ligase B